MKLPDFVQIEPVGQCNLACRMCPVAYRGEGATRGNLWYYRSLFFAEGKTAYRVTAGADARDWAVIAPVFDRLLKSVTFRPGTR